MWFFENGAKIFLFVILIIVALIIIQQIIYYINRIIYFKKYKFRGQHVFITGGSVGLGKDIAKRIACEGAKITIVARRKDVLKQSSIDIENYAKDNGEIDIRVQYFSADVTKEDEIRKCVKDAEFNFGPIDFLIMSHGISIPKYLFEATIEDSNEVMNINYFGSLNVIRAVVPLMMKRNQGEILAITSELSLTGYIGYSHYCASKFATRALIDVMRNELSGYKIKIHCAYPPNMDTEGFHNEQITKPEETKAIEKRENLYDSDHCAKAIVNGIKKGDYHLSCGDFGCNLLIRGVIGINQRDNMVADILIMPILIIVSVIYNYMWKKEVNKEKYQMYKSRWFAGI